MHYDIILEGKAYLNGTFQSCCIGIEDEKIQSIKKVLTGGKKIRFSKELILPAGIDIHVHFRDPGFPQKETFLTGSTAAAFGGITCVFDMPNTKPQTIHLANVKDKIENANKKSLVDFGVYGCICDDNVNNFLELQNYVHGFKIFLGSTTNALQLSLEKLHTILSIEKRISKPLLFHAEDRKCLQNNNRDEESLKDHYLSRPPICELKAIQSIIQHRPFSCPIHICHVSSKQSIQFLNQCTFPISMGITPHHSLLSISDTLKTNQTWYKTNPPIRTKEHQNTLYHALQNGLVPILESDHAPHMIEEKDAEFKHAPSGIPGVETMLPLFLYKAVKQEMPFHILCSMISEKPAQLLKLNKGKISCGHDADIIIINPKKQENITSDLLHSKSKCTPFEGFPAVFPQHVYLRGEEIINKRELVTKPGTGNYVGINQSI